MIQLAISGCQGRMGQAISKLAVGDEATFQISALLEGKAHPQIGETVHTITVSDDNSSLRGSDVLIEFTTPEATMANLAACIQHKVKMVIGTTGLDKSQVQDIAKASSKIPIVFASNMSVGVNILFKLIEITAAKIGADSTTIAETHHIHKKDKPSGTAKSMAQLTERASGHPVDKIDAFREGEVIGNHEITFNSPDDVLKISHQAKDRRMFAKGALLAAQFLMDKDKGLFNMQDVLGLT